MQPGLKYCKYASTPRHIGGLNCCCFSPQSFAPRSFPSGTDQIIFFSPASAQNQFQLDQEWLMRNHFVKCDLWIVVFYYNIREQTTLRFHTYPRRINNSWISSIPLDIYNALANVLNLESKLQCARKLTSAKLSLFATCVMTSYSPFLFLFLRLYISQFIIPVLLLLFFSFSIRQLLFK